MKPTLLATTELGLLLVPVLLGDFLVGQLKTLGCQTHTDTDTDGWGVEGEKYKYGLTFKDITD